MTEEGGTVQNDMCFKKRLGKSKKREKLEKHRGGGGEPSMLLLWLKCKALVGSAPALKKTNKIHNTDNICNNNIILYLYVSYGTQFLMTGTYLQTFLGTVLH